MNGITRTLFLSFGAAGALLTMSLPATAGENTEVRDGRHRFAQVDSHRGQRHAARSHIRDQRMHSGPRLDRLRVQRVHNRGHYRRGHRHWRGYYRRGHRTHWRLYGHYPRYGHRYGY